MDLLHLSPCFMMLHNIIIYTKKHFVTTTIITSHVVDSSQSGKASLGHGKSAAPPLFYRYTLCCVSTGADPGFGRGGRGMINFALKYAEIVITPIFG